MESRCRSACCAAHARAMEPVPQAAAGTPRTQHAAATRCTVGSAAHRAEPATLPPGKTRASNASATAVATLRGRRSTPDATMRSYIAAASAPAPQRPGPYPCTEAGSGTGRSPPTVATVTEWPRLVRRNHSVAAVAASKPSAGSSIRAESDSPPTRLRGRTKGSSRLPCGGGTSGTDAARTVCAVQLSSAYTYTTASRPGWSGSASSSSRPVPRPQKSTAAASSCAIQSPTTASAAHHWRPRPSRASVAE
mmetsp:Transcript_10093/g.39319  ORF Transcript_10093/g.39319 Transcript_10093/m.39319 type:complete len:250 (+) Transcript_10093:1227-1976(+)